MTNYRKKLLWLYARKRGSGSGGISVSVSGTTPVTLANAIESAIRHMTQFGKLTQSGTPTTANPVDIVCNNGALKWDSENQRIYADGTPEVLTVSADDVEDQTASVENLLAVGPVADEQDIITGKVIRRTEAFVYDGTQTVKPTFMSTTGAATEGAIIVQPIGAEYAGDVVSFEAQEGENIDSLKVTLTPKQEGTGDPSPDNIRPITGTEQAEVVQRGINLWDEEWEVGAISNSTGLPSDANNCIRSKNYIPVAPNTTYYINVPVNVAMRYYDADKNFLGVRDTNGTGDVYAAGQYSKLRTTQINCRYIKFQTWGGTGATYNHDISINYPATDTAYHAYDPQSTMLQIEWGALGKNLCPRYTQRESFAGIDYTVTDTGIRVHGTATNASYSWTAGYDYESCPIHLEAGTYTFSATDMVGANQQEAYLVFMGFDSDGTSLGNVAVINSVTTSVTKTFTKTVGLYYGFFVKKDLTVDSVVKVQLETGSTKTTYEPYTKTIYGGHVDAVRGEVVVTYKKVGLNDVAWRKDSTYNYYVTTAQLSDAIDANASANNSLSSGYQYNPIANANALLGHCLIWKSIRVRESDMSLSADDWKALRASENIQFLYRLAEPIYIPLSPHTLTALAKNTVWSDAGPVDVLLNDELVELVAKQPLRTAEGDNTVSVVSEVGEVELAVTYKGGSE